MRAGRVFAAWLLLAFAAGPGGAQDTPQRMSDQGIDAEFRAQQNAGPGGPVSFRFQLSDSATGNPMRGLRPAAWLSRRAPGASAPNCRATAAAYLGGDLFKRADVDLNSFFVLTLNDEASLSVVDPLFGFGRSKLLTMLQLESRGADWALDTDRPALLVSMPAAGKVALIDTRQWRIVESIRTAPNPGRMLAGGARMWVADDQGVSGIDPATRTVTSVPLGGRAGDLAVSADGALLFAAMGGEVAIIDTHTARIAHRVSVPGAPTMLAYSAAAQAVYALDPQQGKLFAIDARSGRLTATVDVARGAAQIRFAPGGRYALMPNPRDNLLQVIDAATNRIVHAVTIGAAPDQVTFSERLAYVRRRDSEIVLMIGLEQLGNEGRALGLAEFPGGQHGFGQRTGVLADSMAGAPEGGSMLVANPADRMVYMYREGMAAPAGGFSSYAQTPRAVMVVDHGLRETGKGMYATTLPVKQGGLYDVVMFIDAPRVVACFVASISDAPGTAKAAPVRVSAIDPPSKLVAGQPARLRFALTDAEGRPLAAAADVRALAFAPPGVWQRRLAATALPGSRYDIEFTAPQAGVYYVWIESESLGLARNNPQLTIFEAH